MRRADRLFQIVQILRHRQLTTATHLAQRLEVSERTIYRDIRDLMSSGVPVNGEAGVGYTLEDTFNFPPLQFTEDEVEALVLGLKLAERCVDEDLQYAAASVLNKVRDSIPVKLQRQIAKVPLSVPIPLNDRKTLRHMAVLRKACTQLEKVTFAYKDESGSASERTVRPLELTFWGKVWMLTAWCELRKGFRNFRLDRMQHLKAAGVFFVDEPSKSMSAYQVVLRHQSS